MFVQKCVPYTDQLFVRLSSTGKRLCTIKSIDYSTITSFCVHECEGPSRLNSRPRRYLFTGHSNGTIQMWDLTTALELKLTNPDYTAGASGQQQQTAYQQAQQHPRDLTMHGIGGPTPSEFAKLLDRIELASTTSGYSTPTTNNCFSPCGCGSGGGGGVSSSFVNNFNSGNGNSNSNSGCGSGGMSKYANKNLLINSAANLTSSNAHSHYGGAQHVGSILHHHNLLVDDDKTSKTISNE